jgi:hypothetical protein
VTGRLEEKGARVRFGVVCLLPRHNSFSLRPRKFPRPLPKSSTLPWPPCTS